MKWSDLYQTPKGLLISVSILMVIYGICNPREVNILLVNIFLLLEQRVLPIVIILGIIIFVLRSARGK
jgi:hypothetical protein